VLDGTVEWIITDHAACPQAMKVVRRDPENIWAARAGFGGTEYLLPAIYSEGVRRGLSPNRVAELLCWQPAQRFGLSRKGDVAPGFDADLVLLDPDEQWTIDPAASLSAQEYTPFAGLPVTGQVKQTFVRGNLVYDNGRILGQPLGQYQKRPELRFHRIGTAYREPDRFKTSLRNTPYGSGTQKGDDHASSANLT
jgi:allantoinase